MAPKAGTLLESKMRDKTRDNAGKNKSQEIIDSDYFESVGVKTYISTIHQQRQTGLAEAAINSIMRTARKIMA
jgi:hypothetical protein